MSPHACGAPFECVGEVMVVGSGTAALDAARSFEPHVVVCDMAMPGMDGYTLVSELHARMGDAAPPAIALSAFLTDGDLERWRAAICGSPGQAS